MNVSKLSRRLIVTIFFSIVTMLAIFDLILIFSNIEFKFSIFYKTMYILLIIVLIAIYTLIKEKLSKKKIKRKISIIYRYIYLIVIAVSYNLISLCSFIDKCDFLEFISSIALYVISAVLLKKIIFNISKSDLLSVTGMLLYVFIPRNIYNFNVNIEGLILLSLILFIIYVFSKLIDELKQLGIKSKKYILLSAIIGVSVSFTLIYNFNILIWIGLLLSLFFITSCLDKTHINFSNKIINSIRQKSKELLYRIERIYINKIFISILIISVIGYSSYFVINKVDLDFKINNYHVNNNLIQNINEFKTFDKNVVITNINNLVTTSKGYFFSLLVYIILIEILTLMLRRRYDTKSTVIKLLFVLVVMFYSIFSLNILIYQPIILTLLILIAIVNTSNIYLNRDERIKLLN
jgi:hypothetical protein